MIQQNKDWGLNLIKEVKNDFNYTNKILDKYTEEQIAKIYKFFNSECHQLILYLRRKGTYEAVDAIQNIINSNPEKHNDLSFDLLIARENARRITWKPPNADNVLKILLNSSLRIIQSERHLMELIRESLKRLQDKLHGKGLYHPCVRYLWDKQKNGYYAPILEEEFSDYIKNHLIDDISSDVIVNREVQMSEKSITDILVQASLKDGHPSEDIISVIIEVKGFWNPEIKTAMEEQLLNKYMKPNDIRYGLFLVGWFRDASKLDPEDYKYSRNKKDFPQKENLSDFLEDQAKNLSKQGFFITSHGIDACFSEIEN